MPRFDILMRRTWPLSPGERYRLRVIFVGEFVEVYIDDVLALNAFLEMPVSGGMGLYVEEGTAQFRNMTYRSKLA
jgi:hypothetical protein